MKVVDVNVLIYATDTATPHHGVAKVWLDRAMSGNETVGLPTAVTMAFIRLTTNPKVFKKPLAVTSAVDIVEYWLARPNVSVPQPTAKHYQIVRELLEGTGAESNLVTDAHLAALAIEHGAELVSFDRDFGRFPRVIWELPE